MCALAGHADRHGQLRKSHHEANGQANGGPHCQVCLPLDSVAVCDADMTFGCMVDVVC
jgi:hypothetical protein